MIHAVLAEDNETVSHLLDSSVKAAAQSNVNSRFKDNRHGRTPVSCAIEQRNLNILQSLVNSDRANLNIRVKVNEDVSLNNKIII